MFDPGVPSAPPPAGEAASAGVSIPGCIANPLMAPQIPFAAPTMSVANGIFFHQPSILLILAITLSIHLIIPLKTPVIVLTTSRMASQPTLSVLTRVFQIPDSHL